MWKPSVPMFLMWFKTYHTAEMKMVLATLGELWGFFKYYHPQVAKGKWNWDSVLMVKIPLYLKAKNKQTLSALTSDWMEELGLIVLTCTTLITFRAYDKSQEQAIQSTAVMPC